jgi:hypothetical protein
MNANIIVMCAKLTMDSVSTALRGILETIVRNSVAIADVVCVTAPLVPASLAAILDFTGTRVKNRAPKIAWYVIRLTANA